MDEQPTTQVIVQTAEVQVATKTDLKVIEAKIASLRAWGIAALVGGQALAGLIAALVGPRDAAETVTSLARATGLF